MESKMEKQRIAPAVKKVLSLSIAIVMLFSITAGIDFSAFAAIKGDFEYSVLEDGTVEITKYTGSASNLTIPSTIYDDEVTRIADEAFFRNTNLESIVLPDSVISIGDHAFYGCSNLTNINIPNGVTQIAPYVFCDCINLTTINIPNGVTSIDDSAFYNCTSLENLDIPNSVTSIGEYAFFDCTSLTNVNIPNGVKYIQSETFHNCKSLTSINIPDSVVYIGCDAFYGCLGLTSVTIPASVESFGENPFCGCSGLKSVIIEDGATTVGDFSNCESLTSITIPDSVTVINSFNNCVSLTSINIPNGVTSVFAYTFYNCTGLTSVNIPVSVKSVDNYAFYHCTNISDVYYGGTIAEWNEIFIGRDNECLTKSIIHCSDGVINCNHSYDSGKVTKAATCTAAGIKTYTCSKCKATKTEAISIIGHTVITDKAVAATCTTAGKTAGSHCSVCNTVIAVQSTIPATGHSYDSGKVTKSATCTASGIKTYTCINCEETKSETISAKGHTVVTDKAIAATCTKAGKTAGSHCSVCNTVIKKQETIKATGHSYDSGKVTKAPTVTATGVKTYTCTKCKATKTETIKATGLKAPTLKVTVNSNGTFKMTWNKVSGADKYEIYYKQTDGSYKLLKTVAGTSYTTVFAQYGKQYSYKMRAVTGNTKSDYSKVVNATNNKKLQAPTLKVAVNSNGTFKMTWNKVTGATSYQIYWKQANGSYKLLKTVTGTSYTSGFAQYGKQYSYKVRAVTSKNSSATSNYSSVVNAKNTKKLGTPTMKAAVNKNGSFKLSWGKVTGATSYQIYWKQANGSYKLLKTVSGTSYTTVVAAKGKTYTYKVRAVTKNNKNATSNYSNVVNAKRK